MLRWDLCVVGGEVDFFCNFLGDVGTHRPQARVSAVEKAEEAWDF